MLKNVKSTPPRRAQGISALFFLFACHCAYAQLSPSAYRVLGQVGFTQDSLNLVQGVELYSPSGVALDTTNGVQVHLYIADTRNSRILAWADVSSYQVGDAPALILGQSSPQNTSTLGIGAKGFSAPVQMAVDPLSGNLYVADYNNNRVLRFPAPFLNPNRIEPDAVYGQASFTALTVSSTSATSLRQPRSVAFDSAGNLWVADSGNNRILRFSAATLNNPAPIAADTVIGQKDFVSSGNNGGGTISNSGFDLPASITFDAQDNLYVADFNNTRVIRFAAPLGPATTNASASLVWGESSFAVRGVPAQATASSLAGPTGVAVDQSGNLYVSTLGDNRVLVFPASGPNGVAAKSVFGQSDFATTTPNTGAFPQASLNSLSGPLDVKVDRAGNVVVADSGNNRVVEFPAASKSAAKVWGQNDFVSNGPNEIKPASLNFPYQIAIDYSKAPFPLYVADTGNHRVLVWKDSVQFRSGDPADLVIGQPNMFSALPNVDSGTAKQPSSTSLSSPTGIAVNPSDGTLYVADSGNNRVLRFPRPVNQNGRITPDAVIGQANFTTSTSASISASSLNSPGGVAIGPNGDLFVADSGNNRVLEFPAAAGTGSSALRVYGQPSMNIGAQASRVSAQTLAAPQGIFVDQASNLYVADAGANRVLIFPNTQNAPPAGQAATAVLGQADLSGTPGVISLKAPVGVGVDTNGNVYVSDSGNNRVLVFSWPGYLNGGVGASTVIGQGSASGTAINWDAQAGFASADGLYNPVAVYLDRQDTLYVGDAGNNRVLQFLKAAVISNGATLQSGVPLAPGSIGTLIGSGLANGTAVASDSWPSSLLNRQVVINDQLVAPLYYQDQNQVNFQLPSNTPLGSQRVAVRLANTGELVAGGNLIAAAVSPGIFTLTQNGSGQAAVRNQDNSINGPGNAASIGSTIQIFGTGQGQVSPGVPDGTPASGSPLSSTIAVPTADSKTCFATQPSMCVAIGSGFGTVQYSGLAPGFIGLWQINVTIPAGIATGNAVPIRVLIDGASSNAVTIAVK
jgi:uncharacterized protein (TIGR03437 family)